MACIIVADDEEIVRKLIRQLLEKKGHSIFEAENGQEALELCLEAKPDLLVTDLLMPEKSGLAAIIEIRAQLPDLPILAISGGGRSGKLNFLNTAKTFSNVATLSKPFDVRSLSMAVDGLLSGPGQPRAG